MKYWKQILIGAAVAASVFTVNGCNKSLDPDSTEKDSLKRDLAIKKYLKDAYMDVYYYWSDYVPDNVEASSMDIFDYFDALLYSKDRWSWMMDRSYYITMTTGTVSSSYGISYGQMIEYYKDYDVRVKYVIDGGPMYNAGVRRGWVLDSVGGKETMDAIRAGSFTTLLNTSPQTFIFTDLGGKNHTLKVTAGTYTAKSYFKYCLFTSADFPGLTEPVGYFNYRSFMSQKLGEVREAFAYFKKAGVKKLILDLRYNGGGDGDASQLLADYLAPASANGEVYCKRSHNAYLKSKGWDEESKVERNDTSLELDHLYIITSSSTASASEVILNGMKPLMNVTQVGDTTYGKPNGMYVLFYPGTSAERDEINAGNYSHLDYCFLPICFYNQNKNGEGNFENGIYPDNYRPDDLTHDLDANEDNIKACLTHIVTGSFPALPSVRNSVAGNRSQHYKASFDDSKLQPAFGTYLIHPDESKLKQLEDLGEK